tara:strand:- start:3810 stop:5504 length:1695 start_codon:yes stop_codon:yes gene_type:complete
MQTEQQLEQYVGQLAGDFEFFCQELWESIGLPNLADHQRQIGQWLQTGPRRRGVRAFRGASKTWVTLGYCAWLLFNDPQHKILLVSKSERHSKDSLFMLRRWIGTVPWLQHLRPDSKGGQRDSATNFDVGPAENDRTPSFTAAGISNQLTGRRANTIVADDCETSENTLTLEMRDRLREQVKEFENILIPGGSIVILGTPHTQESLYTKLADSGYLFKAWPARYPTPEERIDDLADTLRERLDAGTVQPGDSTWPERFTDQELTEREASEGRSTFGMQYQMLTHLGDGLEYPLKLEDFILFPCQRDQAPLTIAWGKHNDRGGTTRVEDIASLGFGTDGYYAPIMYAEEWRPYTGTKLWIDPAGAGADSTGYAVVSHLNGYLHIKAVGGLEGGYSTPVLEELARLAKHHGAREIYIEDNFGTGMMRELLAPVISRHAVPPGNDEHPDGWSASIDGVRVSGQKEIRIITSLEPLLNSHRLLIHPEAASNHKLQQQLTRITRQRNCLRHEDELEALAMCCHMWKEVMSVDPEVGANRRRDQELEERLREHYAAMGLASAEPPRWFKH